jgi:Carboxypeptidase regulatory-like domain
MKSRFLQLFLLLMLGLGVQAQVTTSSISGKITDEKSVELIGANVLVIHTPSGTQYGTITNESGQYSISNMRVGGPYSLSISYVGYQDYSENDIYLNLGQTFLINAKLSESSVQLGEVTVIGIKDNLLNSKRTGASTNISKRQLESMPTLSRGLSDFTRLTPQANGSSFGGANNRFNNITIDGAVNNDVFGLSGSGTPGGQANTQPISLDAIQELQVVLAPYDVSYGNFTGGGINAVTRSGTNNTEGSVYFFNRNQNTIGKSPLTNLKATDFNNTQFGFRLGGALVKNKLFYFVNAELGNISSPLTFNAGETGSAISLATAELISKTAKEKWNYDVGSYNLTNAETKNSKFLVKLDYNINNNHQLSIRNNYIDAFDDNISRSGTFFRFGNNAYKFNNTQNITVAELRSKISNNVSNNLIVGYSRIRDTREIAGSLFPQITIANIDGKSTNSVEFGSQRSSTANELDQDIFEITDNVKINRGKHTFTLGTHNEFFKFRNLFINNYNGRWDFNSVQDFVDNKPFRARATYSIVDGVDKPSAEFSAMQLGFYVQDEFSVSDKLKITAGIRLDVPIIADEPLYNMTVDTTAAFGDLSTTNTPSGQLLWSPRLGFNYDVTGDRSVQLRGGAGIFTGRVPFVWLSNQFSNSGKLFGTVDVRDNLNTPVNEINKNNGFEPIIANQKNVGNAGTTTEINLVSKDFRLPQVLRFNLASDFKLPYGVVATLEGIYSKTLNNVIYSDINLKNSTGTIDTTYSKGSDKRALYNSSTANKVNRAFTNVILLDNTNEGYNYSLTGQLTKQFDNGLNAMVAYTYGQARSINDGASSTALSNWEFVQTTSNPNNPDLAISNFQLVHRIIGALGYNIKYGKNESFGTGINIFYAGRSGNPFSYVYAGGDLNGDGAFSNDLVYIPKTRSEINLLPLTVSGVTTTPEEQWNSLNAFIENDEYLNSRRGQYAERNGAETPWEHQLDLRITQDLGTNIGKKKHGLQLTFDIFNFTNLLNKEWGRQYFVSNQALTLLNVDTAANRRGFTYRNTNPVGWNVSDFASRWQMQIGVRYIFN